MNVLHFFRHFLVLDSIAVSIFTYAGRLHLTPKYSGLTAQLALLNEKTLSLGLNYMAARDCGDESCMYFYFFFVKFVYSLLFNDIFFSNTRIRFDAQCISTE